MCVCVCEREKQGECMRVIDCKYLLYLCMFCGQLDGFKDVTVQCVSSQQFACVTVIGLKMI